MGRLHGRPFHIPVGGPRLARRGTPPYHARGNPRLYVVLDPPDAALRRRQPLDFQKPSERIPSMTKSDTRAGRVVLLFVLALMLAAMAAPALAQESESDADWLPVTLLYMSDVKGKIEPCG